MGLLSSQLTCDFDFDYNHFGNFTCNIFYFTSDILCFTCDFTCDIASGT